MANLLKVLVEISKEIEARLKSGGEEARKAFAARVKSLVEDVPDLPNFSHFHDRFRDEPQGTTLEGDMRSAFYMAYDHEGCEHLKLINARRGPRRDRGEGIGRAERDQYFAKPHGSDRRDKQPDPNSPFAKLAALKQQLEQGSKKPT